MSAAATVPAPDGLAVRLRASLAAFPRRPAITPVVVVAPEPAVLRRNAADVPALLWQFRELVLGRCVRVAGLAQPEWTRR